MRGSWRPRGLPLLSYFVVLLAVFALVATTAVAYVASRSDRDARESAWASAAYAARVSAGQLASFVSQTRSTVEQLASNPAVRQALTAPAGCSLTFSGLAGRDGSHLDVIRSDGSVACTSTGRAGSASSVSYARSPWFRQAQRKVLFLAPVMDARTGNRVLVASVPIPGGGGSVVAAFDNLRPLGPKLADLYGGGRPVEFLITTDAGTVIGRSIHPARWIGKRLTSAQFAGHTDRLERSDLDGTSRYYASAPVRGLPWTFYAGENKTVVQAAARRLRQRELVIVLVGLLAAVLGSWAIYRGVVSPIRLLARAVATNRGAQGAVEVSTRWPKEIVSLAEEVNVLIASVEYELAERKNAEAQLVQASKMEGLGQLAGGVAHDFNNLLTAIAGYGDLALRKSNDPHVLSYINEVLFAAERAGDLTHQLLAFSRNQPLDTRPLDVNRVVDDTEKLLQRLIGDEVQIVTSLRAEAPIVLGNPGQLSQIIINLAVNARDAMPDGGTLTLETSNVELDRRASSELFDAEPGPYVRLSVTDTGEGIPEEAKDRLFEPFFTTKEVGAGTGLGLSMTYGIIKQLGGQVTVYSEPGEGAVFNVYLPQSSAAAAVEPEAPYAASRGTESILLVEDNEIVCSLVSEMLESQGYRVTATGDPEKALALVAETDQHFDLLITDVVMAKLNGRQVAEALTARLPHLRVLYVSGYTSTIIIQRGLLPYEVAFLQKPFILRELAARVREVLDKPTDNARLSSDQFPSAAA